MRRRLLDISVEKVSSTESLDWTASIMTGVDWKSLCMPASLPLTISHFPDEPSLKKFYSENHYNLVIEDAITIQDKEKKDCGQFDRSSLPPEKKFMEMISQRLAQVGLLLALFFSKLVIGVEFHNGFRFIGSFI